MIDDVGLISHGWDAVLAPASTSRERRHYQR
jgi:hypothetical protein